jgi:hypothetical protein
MRLRADHPFLRPAHHDGLATHTLEQTIRKVPEADRVLAKEAEVAVSQFDLFDTRIRR